MRPLPEGVCDPQVENQCIENKHLLTGSSLISFLRKKSRTSCLGNGLPTNTN